ncbi:type III-A CRISPR-associated protein Csm2 [Dolosicoccus paucivorans]|uniref:CRISPR system Cms protein Csm2 n=1 Tax=Dolosicoccus paucivorans TaxID=84521 RepID=A0A1G8JUM9_9LACT|nr:type III-A CRISPR-associated protein Csm2 [Dolosicoccus paucivorans]PMB85056.1 type III-A CRISPR-associated protein Csm2 [Dolosicoccus paucivorans]PMC58988.1 type III-A CRISPR-associated protein Csm2 [Dolosicoccus paucivorans]SDI34888.1 CRISPR-associated protein, Csm2 family [Dolosicoccus paucivorans]
MATLTTSNYIDKAEKVFDDHWLINNLTTSQIRKLLNLTSRLYDESKVKSYEQLEESINYLRVQFLYQAGRESAVKTLVERANLIEAVKEIKDIDSLRLFSRYMEALVAYHRYKGGED